MAINFHVLLYILFGQEITRTFERKTNIPVGFLILRNNKN
jgi:hypothetical protein